MRRSDREVSGLANILEILDKCEVLRLGLCLDDKPYIVPMNFAFDVLDGAVSIYLHCARTGKKLDIIAKNNNIFFESDCSYKTLPASPLENACNWSAEFASIMGEGTVTIVEEEKERTLGLDLLLKHYGFTGKAEYNAKELQAVTVLKIDVASISGKIKS